MIGIDPGPCTLRELIWMTEARQRDAWDRAASLMTLLANCHRDPKKPAFGPHLFHPFLQRPTVRKGHISELKSFLRS